jgi:cytoskeletal protein CcmA (bactofilin family)
MALINQKKPDGRPTVISAPIVEHQSSLIGKTLLIKGEVISDDEVVIEGRIEGKVNVKNRVVIGKNGFVKADIIEAREVIIRGKVNGNIRGTHRVEIVPEGILNGNIQAPKVVIADGAIFEGNIDMRAHGADEKPKLGGGTAPSTPVNAGTNNPNANANGNPNTNHNR